MKLTRPIALGAIALLILSIVAGKYLNAANKGDDQKPYNNVVTVNGFVLQAQPFTRYIEESGTLTGKKESIIAAQTGGQIKQVSVDVGDYVSNGSPLVRLDDEVLGLEADRAKIAYDKAALDFDRLQKLYEQNSISESDLENARLGMKGAEVQYRLSKKTYDDATIRAPFSGTIASRMTEVGQMIDRGQPVVQLVDVSTLKLTVTVSESNIKDVFVGADASVFVEATGDTVPGKVTAVGSRALNASRTFPVEVEIPGSDRLRSGMFARTRITGGTIENGLLLPRAAVLPDMGRTVVFLARGAQAEKVIVKVIGQSGDRLAVSGIAPGDTVIVTGNQSLSQGTPINLTLVDGSNYDTH